MDSREIQQRAQLVFEMLEASHGLIHWVYDDQGSCLSTNSQSNALAAFLEQSTGKADFLAHGRQSQEPLLLSLPLGLVWAVVYERQNNALHRCYVLGPALHTEISMRGIVGALDKYKIPQDWKSGFMSLMQSLPVLSVTSLRRVAVMLHYAVSGEAINVLDIHALTSDPELFDSTIPEKRDRHRTYLAERRLLDNVRQGNLDYQADLAESAKLSAGVRVKTDTAEVQVRTTQIVFISLCVRAAIEGGLTPDIAYSIGDSYIQKIHDAEDVTRMGNIGHEMYHRFIQLVHESKARPQLSGPIQAVCDYISLHVQGPLPTEDLAYRVGYSPSYLARQFHRETGLSLTDYIKKERIRRACLLLTTTLDPIPEISRRLQFCNRGYFSRVFKEEMGMTPVEYRKKNQVD